MKFLTSSVGKLILVTCIVLLSVALLYVNTCEVAAWNKFSTQHNCQVVNRTNGQIFNTHRIDSSGNSVRDSYSTSGKTGYACNNGITYYR